MINPELFLKFYDAVGGSEGLASLAEKMKTIKKESKGNLILMATKLPEIFPGLFEELPSQPLIIDPTKTPGQNAAAGSVASAAASPQAPVAPNLSAGRGRAIPSAPVAPLLKRRLRRGEFDRGGYDWTSYV